jgi:2-phospho-L-lactate/phosphoenolpyruvate guanylyltransferase
MNAGLLPVKDPTRSKSRLSPAFTRSERSLIARALFEDALALCRRIERLQWWVVSDSAAIRDAARAVGLGTLEDPGKGLNTALRLGLASSALTGADSVLIVPADVPLATPADMDDLLDTAATSDVVLVPSLRDGGTNGLYMSPPGIIDPSFGTESLAAHAKNAEAAALRCSILEIPGLSLDIDRVEDIEAFLGDPAAPETATGRVLVGLGPGRPRASVS